VIHRSDLLAGKKALVTGAGVRLGKAIALALADAGAWVAVHHHRSVAGAQQTVAKITAAGRDAFSVRADLTQPDDVERMFEQIDAKLGGGLDILVNSAGVMERVDAADVTPERWQRMFALNVESALWCSQQARTRMLANAAPGGAIVNVTDISARRPWRGYAHYCASKAALESLTHSLALEWAPDIRVNAVAPGAVLLPDASTPEEAARLQSTIPAGRLGTPEDVAETVVFLAGGPKYVTGQVIAVDGGRSLSWK
jgi:pteridine reductase